MFAMCAARFALSFCTCQRSQFYLPPVMENDTCRLVEMSGSHGLLPDTRTNGEQAWARQVQAVKRQKLFGR